MLGVTDARQYSSKVDSATAVWKFDHSLTVWCPLLDGNDRMRKFDCSSSSDCPRRVLAQRPKPEEASL